MDSKHGDMYFNNLLSRDFTIIPHDSPPLPPDDPTSVTKSIRGLNFSLEEEKLLASLSLNCILDSIQEMDKRPSHFWGEIINYFEKLYPQQSIQSSL